MTKLSTTILCGAATARHKILIAKGDVTLVGCDQSVADQARRVVALTQLGRAKPIKAERGCLAFATLVMAIPQIWFDGYADPLMGSRVDAGPFADLYAAYGGNSAFLALAKTHRTALSKARAPLDKALRRALNKQLMQHWSLREALAADVRFAYDVPVEQLRYGWTVASFETDTWTVPYAPDWENQIHAVGLSVVSSRFICGRDEKKRDLLYGIDQRDDGGFIVKPFMLDASGAKPKLRMMNGQAVS
jgi:hypothetical protein